MNRTRPRRTAFGVESLERRDLAAIYMKVDGVVGRVTQNSSTPAEVQTFELRGDASQENASERESTLIYSGESGGL